MARCSLFHQALRSSRVEIKFWSFVLFPAFEESIFCSLLSYSHFCNSSLMQRSYDDGHLISSIWKKETEVKHFLSLMFSKLTSFSSKLPIKTKMINVKNLKRYKSITKVNRWFQKNFQVIGFYDNIIQN